MPGASADALRHVLVGGTPSIQAFAGEVADAEGGDELPHHKATKIIGQVLAEIDSHPQLSPAAVTAATLPDVGAPISGNCDAAFARCASAFADNFAERGEVGAAVCVIVDGEVVVDLVGGWADEAWHHGRGSTDTLVNFYSVGKAFVALLALQLVDAGVDRSRRSDRLGLARVRRRRQGGARPCDTRCATGPACRPSASG